MMIDSYTGKKITRAMGSLWPAPCVEMHFTSGRRMRYTFWAPSKAGPQELIERGILAGASLARNIGTDPNDAYNCWVYPNEHIFRLYVEDKSRVGPWHVCELEDLDPWNLPALGNIKARRTTVKQVKTILADVLSILNGKTDTAKARLVLAQAQELLAA